MRVFLSVMMSFASLVAFADPPRPIQLKSGKSLDGVITKVVPATVTIETKDGTFNFIVPDLAMSEITNLPDIVSRPYKRAVELKTTLDEEVADIKRTTLHSASNAYEALSFINDIKSEQDRIRALPSTPDGLKIRDVDVKVLNTEYGHVNVSWKVRVINLNDAPLTKNIRIKFYDFQDYLLKEVNEYDVRLIPGETIVTGTETFKAELWGKVHQYRAFIKD